MNYFNIVQLILLTHNYRSKEGAFVSRFSYKVFTYNNRAIMNNDETLEADLKELGDQGWELVSALPIVKGDGSDGEVSVSTDDIKFIFKREN
jgi:hypothetical protein